MTPVLDLIHSLVFSLRGWVGRNQSPVMWPYGSGTLHPGQVLGGSLPLLSPSFRLPTFTARCLYVRNDARDPSSERWNCGRETVR